ncbi:hypothetical protein CYMTET_10391 [Cymbomonas tetramitiformis]|uniref:Dynamin GTPase domain-containing protein n=1 Tax=Cymbomonas tetramitiformis TaxID=36881 RepID=A0AAE0GQU4_9CHLO|nr:hypothetical protein CYMTET_10391 [Cymbomonas tetramitiformis]
MPGGSSSNQSQASIPGEFPQLLDNWWWQLCDLWPPMRLLNCPLTNTPLEEPVIADDNRTYNAQALQFFFTSQRDSGLSIVSPQHHEAMSDQYQQDAVTHTLLKIIITRLQDSEFLVTALRDIPDDPGAEHQRALGQLILAAKEACHAAVERSQQENMAGSHWLLEKFQEELREHTLAWEATTSTVQFVQPREDLTQLRLAFSKLDELRELLQETLKGWDPPSITVVGTRSAGKSTVLERLSNIPLFPRNPSICTRLPIHVRLRQSVHGNAQVRLFVKDTQSGEEGPSRFIPFESGHRYVDEVQERILIEHESTTGFSTTKQIILEVHHPTVPSIDLIDIPGLEPGDGRGPTHQILESQVNRNREQGSSAVYLLVVSGASRQVNDVASAFIKEHGLLDETLGVFTHCDDVVSRRYHALREMVEDPQANTASLPVRHGWVATMSCDEHESLPGPERLHRQAQVELEFFEEHHELKAMKLAGNATCSALVRRLQRVYFDHLSNTWTPRTLLRIDERIVEIQFQERSQYGRPLGLLSADERSSAIRNEVRTRLSDCTSMITERFLNEHLRSLHKQFLEKLRAISRKSLMLHDIAEHHRSVREEGLQLFTHILREVEAYWKEGIRSIMFAKLECPITNGEYRFLMVRGESTDASEHQWPGADAGHVRSEEGDNAEDELQRLFTCSSIREAHTWLYEDGERVQLNQYPVLLNNLVQEFEKRLDNSIQNLELELTRLHEVAFDVQGHLMTYTSDEDAWKFELNVEQLAGKLMALMMIHGPSSQLLEGLEDSFQIASEVETCETGRQHFNQEVELLQKAARGVRAIFNLTGDQAEDLKRQVEEERRREEEERRQVEEEGRREEEEHRQVEEEQRREEQERHRQQSQDEAYSDLEDRIRSSQASPALQNAFTHLRQLKSEVRELSFSGMACEHVVVVELAKLLSFNTSLTLLSLTDLRGNTIGDEGAKALAVALTPNAEGVFNTSLNTLDVCCNDITGDAAQQLAEAVLKHPCITEFNKIMMQDIKDDKVTELDLSHKGIEVPGALVLSKLLVSNTSSLNTLNLSYNQLCGVDREGDGTYDASGINALTDALAFNTSLNTVDLSRNRIGDEGAKALAVALTPNAEGVFNTSLNTLDLSNNDIGPEGAKALAVALTPNAVGVFNGSLNTLTLTGNRIGPEGAKALAVALTPNAEGVFNTSLNTLHLGGNNIGNEGAEALAAALSPNEEGVFNTSLNTLNLENNNIGPEGAKALAVALTPNAEGVFNTSLSTVNVWGNAVQLEGARALADAVRQRNAPIKLCGSLLDVDALDLSIKKLKPADAILLTNDLVFNTSLNTLDLEGNNIGNEGAEALAAALSPNEEGVFNTFLNTLNLGRNNIGNEGAEALAAALSPNEEGVFNTSLNTLDLESNGIGPEGVQALADALTPNAEGVFNTSLNALGLGANWIGLEGVQALADALTPNAEGVFNTSLNTLDLSNNDIGPEGAKALAVALTPNAVGVFNGSLNTLKLYDNRIGDEGAKALAVALTPNAKGVFNTSLNELYLNFNKIGDEGAKALAVALTPNAEAVFNGSLNTLDLAWNMIGPEGAKALAIALTPNAERVFNTSLNTLDLGGNTIGDEGAKALAVALTPNAEGVFNTSLNTLHLRSNAIEGEGREALTKAQRSRSSNNPCKVHL